MGLARRRHDLDRMKAKAKRVSRITGGRYDLLYNHLAVCSCQMCRNPRRSSFNSREARLTMQERRADEGWGGLTSPTAG